jgi:ATP-binding cassette subfamily B protein
LVPRLFDVSPVKFFDGRDIRELSLTDLRKMIGHAAGAASLTTLANPPAASNIPRRAPANSIARLDRDLSSFGAARDRSGTKVHCQSQNSGRRRQGYWRIAGDPDDCLSSVDAQTEAEILHGLKSILKEKTCLIISHRISAVKEADEILVLDEGKIIERGNHDELVRRGGVYAELYQQQRLSEELEQI